MSNSTPKRGLSGLMSKFLRSGSGGSSNSSSDDVEGPRSKVQSQASENDASEPAYLASDVEISPLALMNENSPEAWLGQFLLQVELETRRGTIHGARLDA